MGLEFGGNIQDIGDKVRGKCYFDNVTKFYYECIGDTNLTYNDVSKFRAISNKPLSDKVENLFKTEILSMTHLLGYIAAADVTEWYVTLPAHIKKDKVISVTNINQGFWTEYCNLDLASNCVRMGGKGNFSSVPPSGLQVLIAYFT